MGQPSILLLDEATSALDRTNEILVNETLSEIGKGKTIISITHAIHSVKDYDVIFVFDKGKVVEKGIYQGGQFVKSEDFDLELMQKTFKL